MSNLSEYREKLYQLVGGRSGLFFLNGSQFDALNSEDQATLRRLCNEGMIRTSEYYGLRLNLSQSWAFSLTAKGEDWLACAYPKVK